MLIVGGRYAIKEFFPSSYQIESLEEVYILKKLKHPNVVKFVDRFNVGARYFLVMTMATRGDLANQITAQREKDIQFSKKEIKSKFHQFADGIQG